MRKIKIKNGSISNYKYFFKEHLLLHIVLIAALVATTVTLIGVFSGWFSDYSKLNDFSGWASFSAGIMTYIGASFLGLIVFYNSWQRQKMEDDNNKIIVEINNKCDVSENGEFVPYTVNKLPSKFGSWGGISNSASDGDKVYVYLEFILTNYHEAPLLTRFMNAFIVEENIIKKIEHIDFKILKKDDVPLLLREENRYYIGFNPSYYSSKPLRLIFLFYFKNLKHDEKYCLYVLNFYKKAMNPFPIFLSKKEYLKSLKEKGNPFGIYEDLLNGSVIEKAKQKKCSFRKRHKIKSAE